MFNRSFTRRAASAAIAAAMFVACNSSLSLNNETLERTITSGLQEQAQVAANVSCPDDRPIKAGDVFQCQAVTEDGTTLTIQVTQTDDTGHVNWQVVGAS